MERLRKYIGYGFLTFVLMSSVVACTKEELDTRTPKGYVEIALNWDDCFNDEAYVSEENGKSVKKCALLYFYSVDGQQLPEGFNPKESVSEYDDRKLQWTPHTFKGMLPEGEYRVIVMNRKFKNAGLQYEDNYEDARISAATVDESVAAGKKLGCSADTRAFASKTGDLIDSPDSVFLSSVLDGESATLKVVNRDTVTAQASPKRMIKKVSFTITLEDFSATACCGKFGGVASSIKCATCQCLPTSARVKFRAEADAKNPNVFRSSFNVFDLVPAGEKSHMLELTLTIDGVERTTLLNLSDDVLRELGKGEFTYEMPLELNIKVTHTLDGDIHASVEGWDNSGTGSGTGSY